MKVSHLHFEQCVSTNDLAFENGPSLLAREHSNALIVTADEQTKGRGRQGRQWESKKTGNIYCSVFLKGETVQIPPAWIPLAAGVATLSAMEENIKNFQTLNLDAWRIKWPNDILVQHANTSKKIAGILCESRFSGQSLQSLVVGFGFNVFHSPTPESACLADVLAADGVDASRQTALQNFGESFPRQFSEHLTFWVQTDLPSLKKAWLHFAQWDKFPILKTHRADGSMLELDQLTILDAGGIQGRCLKTNQIQELLF